MGVNLPSYMILVADKIAPCLINILFEIGLRPLIDSGVDNSLSICLATKLHVGEPTNSFNRKSFLLCFFQECLL